MRELITEFLDHKKINEGKSKNTITNYSVDLLQLADFLHNKGIDNITEVKIQHLNSFIASFGEDVTNSTKSRKVSAIKSFFEYLQDMDIIIKNPAHKLTKPKLEKKNPIYLNLKQSDKLLNSPEGKYKERDIAILTIFLNCGIRLSELVNIDLDDIRDNILSIDGKGSRQRQVYLNEVCVRAIKDYLKVRPNTTDKALFLSDKTRRITDSGVQWLVKKYLKKTGLDIKKYSTHKLRHTAATLMYQSGVDIRALQDILGHEDLSTTQIYTHVNNLQVKKAMKKHPLNNLRK